MTDMKEFQDHIDRRFDRVEDKIDNHLERLSKAEESIIWIRGHLKISTSLFMAVVLASILAYLNLN